MALTLADLLLAPPPGTYDPSLDAELAAAQRGLSDLESDTAMGSSRALTDYGIGQSSINTSRDRSLAAETRQRDRTIVHSDLQAGRTLSDIVRQKGYESQDYTRSTQGLARQYANLATGQAQGQRQLGDVSGGTSAQSARKRAANQAWTQAGLDTSHTRAQAGYDLASQRTSEDQATVRREAGENFDTASGYTNQDANTGLANLALRYGRGGEDRQNQVTRAQREGQFFEQDVNSNKFWQAVQSGLWPAGGSNG